MLPTLRPLPLLIGLAVTLGACAQISGSRLNPFNWFGPSVSVATTVPRDELRPLVPEGRLATAPDTRVLIAEVTELRIEPMSDGAIVRATGLAATQGYYNAQLVLTGQSGGVLTYDFRVSSPQAVQAAGGAAARSLTVATTLSAAELAGVRSVQVTGQTNARVASR